MAQHAPSSSCSTRWGHSNSALGSRHRTYFLDDRVGSRWRLTPWRADYPSTGDQPAYRPVESPRSHHRRRCVGHHVIHPTEAQAATIVDSIEEHRQMKLGPNWPHPTVEELMVIGTAVEAQRGGVAPQEDLKDRPVVVYASGNLPVRWFSLKCPPPYGTFRFASGLSATIRRSASSPVRMLPNCGWPPRGAASSSAPHSVAARMTSSG